MKKSLPILLIVALFLIASCGKEWLSNTGPSTVSLNVSTLAGSGLPGNSNGAGTNASFYEPTGLAVDTGGNVYVADYRNSLIRKITPGGIVTTFAGGVKPGNGNGNGVYASFNQPTGIAIDAAGNIYVADSNNNLIREIDPSGNVTTLAGSGSAGMVNGMGTGASFSNPEGVAVDAAGNVYVADYGNNMIRKISAGGVVTTLAGQTSAGNANGRADTVATFNQPTGLAVDAAGNVYVADFGNNLIRLITPAGIVSTFAGSGTSGSANGTGMAASFNGPTGIATDAAGNVYVADYGNNILRLITPAGAVTSLGVSSSPANPIFNKPYGVAIDKKGNLYVANYGNSTVVKVSK